MNKDTIRFIDKLYKDLYKSNEVLHHSTGNETDKFRNIDEYMSTLESIHERAFKSEERINTLKRLYFDKYVIKKEDIPNSYYENQERIALERGFGHIKTNEEQKIKLQDEIINNQKKSMEVWLDYFLSEDSKFYPFWAKYWAFQGMIKLGVYDKEKGSFNKRTKETTAPFADLNREALSKSIDLIISFVNKNDIGDNELEAIVRTGSFQKIYPYVLTKVLSNNENIIKRNEGKWIKYNRGRDYMPLVKSLQGYNTGWCTAGESTAMEQLRAGDFYVYYTLDENGEYKIPRIAIRMEDDRIGEIRGIGKSQNIEPEMEKVVEEKIKDFPDKDKYYKKVNDMKMLTEIYNKQNNNQELTKEELRFLYEIDNKIVGFGYSMDPRIEEIKEERNNKKDLSIIFDCNKDQISLQGEKYSSDTVFYYGDLFIYNIHEELGISEEEWAKEISLPKIISGTLWIEGLKKIKDLTLPQSVGASIYLNQLETAENLVLPQSVGWTIFLEDLETVENLVLPKNVGGDIHLNNLEKVKKITLPQSVGKSLNLKSLKAVENLVFPKNVGGDLYLGNLKTAKNVILPKNVGEDLYLGKLETAEDLILPQEITGMLNLKSLKTAKGVTFPQSVGGQVDLNSLETAEDLVLPNSIGGWLCLDSLETAEDLTLPQRVGGGINLLNLKMVKKITLPQSVGTYINLNELKSIDSIIFPDNFDYHIITQYGNVRNNNINEIKKLVEEAKSKEIESVKNKK